MIHLETLQPKFLEYLLTGDADAAVSLAREALSEGIGPVAFFEKCIAPSLEVVGKKFETLDIFLPEMVDAADIVEQVNDKVINPAVAEANQGRSTAIGKVLLATVQGDLHDIGKNMVGLLLKVNGFEVVDMGTSVSPSDIVAKAEEEQVDIIGLSSLLTTCLPYMKDVCTYLDGKGVLDKYKLIIGGAATNQNYAEEIGAHAYGRSAADGVEKCKALIANLTPDTK